MGFISFQRSIKFLVDKYKHFLFQCQTFFLKKPDVIISFGNSLGDDLLCTIVAAQLKKKENVRIWMKTMYPDLFVGNKDFSKIIKKKSSYAAQNSKFDKFIQKCNPIIVTPLYTSYNIETDQDSIPSKHIIHLMCDAAGVSYPGIIKPLFFLSKKEKLKGQFFPNQICVQSMGAGSANYMKNKDWLPSELQHVISTLKNKYTIIQLGTDKDQLLEDVIDMRGKTTIRETAAIIASSKFFIGLVGFLMHLARAVDCKSIIIYGGREHPSQTGYEENINLYTPMFCSPCWLRNKCEFDKECMRAINAQDVLRAVVRIESLIEIRNIS